MKRIVICGSMKFTDIMLEEEYRLTIEGNLVLMPIMLKGSVEPSEKDIEAFKAAHREKIQGAHEVYIINPNYYIGEDTMEEILFALECGVQLRFFEWPERVFSKTTVNTKPSYPPFPYSEYVNRKRGIPNEY
jgi:hypothetical protein